MACGQMRATTTNAMLGRKRRLMIFVNSALSVKKKNKNKKTQTADDVFLFSVANPFRRSSPWPFFGRFTAYKGFLIQSPNFSNLEKVSVLSLYFQMQAWYYPIIAGMPVELKLVLLCYLDIQLNVVCF